jgi:hypothetical protein
VLYELLAGVLPFPEEAEQVAILFKHAFETPVSLRDAAPDVPEPVAAVVMRGLATEPAQRFATAETFGVALAEASTQAWGPGWLPSDVLPLMDAGPIRSAAGPPSAPHGTALPTLPPVAPAAAARETPAAPTVGSPGTGASVTAAGTADPGPPQAHHYRGHRCGHHNRRHCSGCGPERTQDLQFPQLGHETHLHRPIPSD